MTERQAQVLLVAVVTTRATALLFSKALLADMGPFALLGVRFLMAFALLVIVLHRRLPRPSMRLNLYGLALGAGFFAVMSLEAFSLRLTDTSHVAFLENAAIVLVPLGEAIVGRRLPSARSAIGAGAAMAGIGLITLGGGTGGIGFGDLLALGAALFYAAVIMMCSRMSRSEDALALGVLQVGWIGVLGMVAAAVSGESVILEGARQWGRLAFLVVACTGFGFTLQPLAQRHLSAERASLTLAVDPLVASVLGVTVLGERVGVLGILGMAFVLGAIVQSCLSEGRGIRPEGRRVRPMLARPRRTKRGGGRPVGTAACDGASAMRGCAGRAYAGTTSTYREISCTRSGAKQLGSLQ